jgi:UMF1 family MFS transporter
MYDLANQSFQLLINTMLFSVYVSEVVLRDKETGEQWWKVMSAAALLIIVAISPIVGAVADSRAWKREVLLVTGVSCSVLIAGLALVGPDGIVLALLFYIPAAVLCGIGENFLGAFLPEIADERTIGRVSATGWTMSYVGALILIAINLLVFQRALGLDQTAEFRSIFVFAGVWFLAGILPAAFLLRERARPQARTAASGGLLVEGFTRLRDTLRHLPRYRQLGRFLGVFFVYSMGTQVFVYLAAVITKQMGFSNADVAIVGLELTVLAGAGAIIAGTRQDRWGHRRTVMVFLVMWIISMGALSAMAFVQPVRWLFFVLAAGTGLGLGGIGTASRALVGACTPEFKSAEFFGLWGMAYKLAGAAALGTFWLIDLMFRGSPGLSLLLTAGFFAVGLGLLFTVDVQEGQSAAREAERECRAGS